MSRTRDRVRSLLRRGLTFVVYGVLLAPLVGGVVTVWRERSELMESGGWLAMFGHFMAVFMTLATMVVLIVALASLVCVPLLVIYVAWQVKRGGTDAAGAYVSLAPAPASGGRRLARGGYRAADALWKLVWWCGYWLGRLTGGRRR